MKCQIFLILFLIPIFSYGDTSSAKKSVFIKKKSNITLFTYQNNLMNFCKKKDQSCHSHSKQTLKKYEQGNLLDLNFSGRIYVGMCDTYNISTFPFGSYVKIYINNKESDYVTNYVFGYVAEENQSKTVEISPYSITEKELNERTKNSMNKLEKGEDFNYINRMDGPVSFGAWLRETDEGKSLHTYGFFVNGFFVCDTELLYEK